MKPNALALMGTASPDLEKQSFLAVVFVYREYSGQQELAPSFDYAQDDKIEQLNKI
ncbi:hypothetical protein SAMN05444671_4595 [Flavobacterium sp. CF108]|uniref:hypothetical protein n=1 Tax=unclassified Flavobacterium TaxID=196869 RepID=UPI0008B268E6|nr:MULTISPECIES: hypothetical protein [unclassified Flavobacterium]SEP02684.1 hypothetical protein SAMN04487978_4222 [Flavobacterium sp. fv08]SHH98413.1 hypothetical protein SAMN05444671_4595 [Flavobacterium sp. CF108]